MRKLATVQLLEKLTPIEGADRIETAHVLGWQCVVKKGEFREGDWVIYIEVDSIVPSSVPYFSFLQDRKYRVRTIKLRKQISQGLVCPMGELLKNPPYQIGDDVTEEIGVIKYDPQLKEEMEQAMSKPQNKVEKLLMSYGWYRKYFAPKKEKGWPEFIKKTDEERIQNMPWVLKKELGTKFITTEKIDGQSGTYALKKMESLWWKPFSSDWKFYVCSRNVNQGKRNNGSNYWKIAEKHYLEEVLHLFKGWGMQDHVIIQGEIAGPGVQKNKYKLPELTFFVFNVILDGKHLEPHEYAPLFKNRGIQSVPIVHRDIILPEAVALMVELSKGKSYLYNRNREGLVVRNYEKGISFKALNPDFLLEVEKEEDAA